MHATRHHHTGIGRALCAMLIVASTSAWAADMGGYNAMTIERVGRFLGTFGGGVGIKEMTDGVSITLVSEDGGVKPLPIRAFRMEFTWPEGAARPSKIVMQGGVDVRHPEASVTAERAEWDFERNELVFTGNPVMNNETVKGLRGDRMVLNFAANTVEITNMAAEEVPINQPGMGAASDPSLLRESDISDWSGFLNQVKAEASGDEASPGKQLLSRLGSAAEAALKATPTENLVQDKGLLLDQVNGVLTKPGMYSRDAWAGIDLGGEVQALLGKGELSPGEQSRQNRLLLEAAYPNYIRKLQ